MDILRNVALILIALLIGGSLLTYKVSEVGWSYLNPDAAHADDACTNLLSLPGLYLAGLLYRFLGAGALYLCVLMLVYGVLRLCTPRRPQAGMLVSALGAATETADTRQWFTLPAEVRMARLFLQPGTQNIRLLFRDGYGNIVGEHVFKKVSVKKGERVFLYYRTAY